MVNSTGEPLLVVRKLSKRYGLIRAVSEVSLDIESGLIYGIIGPNGAGKSTLFKLLSGFEPPDAGSIRFDGDAVENLSACQRARRGIARTFQELEVFPALTAGEILTTAALMHHSVKEAKIAARGVAERLRLPWSTYARELNPSTIRQMELARCILAEPKLVLFDEVMAGLTIAEADVLCGLIKELHMKGVGIIVVEHVMRVVKALCDHLYVMAEGEIIASGEPVAIMSDPVVKAAYLGVRAKTGVA